MYRPFNRSVQRKLTVEAQSLSAASSECASPVAVLSDDAAAKSDFKIARNTPLLGDCVT